MTTDLSEWLGEATITYAVYTPSELERISGLGVDMQRVWRRRGQLPPTGSGHARFSIAEAIDITFRYALSKVGVPPSETGLNLAAARSAAMFHAVLGHGGCEVTGPSDDVERFLYVFDQDDGALGRLLSGSIDEANYIVLNEWRNARIVSDLQELIFDDEELNIVFNLELLGRRLVERARKPVVSVSFRDRSGVRAIRRLTGVTPMPSSPEVRHG